MSKLKFDVKDIKQLSDLMKEVDVEEIEITQDGDTLRLRRPGVAVAPAMPVAAPAAVAQAATTTAPAEVQGEVVKAPLVGTFYHAPAPDKDPFVTPGKAVKKGDVIGIIEAMKTMNPVESTADGEIAEIVAENATPVEFGQPLVRFK